MSISYDITLGNMIICYQGGSGSWKGIKGDKEYRDNIINALRKYWKTHSRDFNSKFWYGNINA